jgi:Intracellular proteinase inhibitor
MHVRHAVALVAALALAYASGSRTHAFSMVTAGATPARGETVPATAERTHHAAPTAALTTTLDVMVNGDEVRFVLHVTNNSSKKLELTFPNGQTHDLAVLDAAGSEVWRWGSAQMFTQALRNQPLDAHGSLTYPVRWRQPSAHGPLTAVATLTSTNYPAESRAAFALP